MTTFGENRPKGEPLPPPPAGQGTIVHYSSPAGRLSAYMTAIPADGRTHPAIVWITGGDTNTVDAAVWDPPALDDQTAREYREAGIVTLYPSLRGGNDSPGRREGFFGEVDDILAAADFLAAQPGIDPRRIYLGGHSTGGTLVFLVAETSPRFRAVFSFGPVADPRQYPRTIFPFDTTNEREMAVRRPLAWLGSVESPLYVFEGASGGVSNIRFLERLRAATNNRWIHFHPVPGADHFTVLTPANRLIARKILGDAGSVSNITFSLEDLTKLMH